MAPGRRAERKATTLVLLAALAVAAWMFTPRPVRACIHPEARSPKHSSVDVEQSEQTALIYFDGERERLYLSTGAEPSDELSKLGWVIPVPKVPGDYGTAAPDLFTNLGEWMNLRRVVYERPEEESRIGTLGARSPFGSDDETRTRSLEVMPTVETGPYDITPLKARGEAGLKALKEWLTEHGLQTPDSTEPARYYVERGWTFLAVQVAPSEGSETLDLDGNLRPLYLSFETDRAIYPLKFETNQGEFPVTIHLVTNRRIPDAAFDALQSKGFWVAGYYGEGRPTSVAGSDRDAGPGASDRSRNTASKKKAYPGNCRKPPGEPHKLHYVVDRGIVEEDSAPEVLVDALGDAGAWKGRSVLAIRTLHVPTFNKNRTEPDDWDGDFAVPAFGSSRTLTALMGADASNDAEAGTSDDTELRDASSKNRRDATSSEPPDSSVDSADPRAASGDSRASSSGSDEGNSAMWILGVVAVVVAAGGLALVIGRNL